MDEGKRCWQGDRSSLRGGRNEESKARAAVWGKVWSSKVKEASAQRGCAGEVAGNLQPATEPSSVPGVRADCHRAEHRGPAVFWHGKADPVQCPSRESEIRGESLTSQEEMPVKPSSRLSTLYLKTQPVRAACPLISYLGKILPLENTNTGLVEFLKIF